MTPNSEVPDQREDSEVSDVSGERRTLCIECGGLGYERDWMSEAIDCENCDGEGGWPYEEGDENFAITT